MARKTKTTAQSTANILPVRGANPEQRVLFMSLFTQGLDGRRGITYNLVSAPGMAKTSISKQLSRAAGLPYEAVLGSIRQPMDFLGALFMQRMPLTPDTQHLAPDGDSHLRYGHYAPTGFAVRAAVAKRSVIHFDEVSACTASVQSALLRVLFEGVVGELELPKETRFILSMNPVAQSAGGRQISMPMANRIGWVDWPAPTVDDFATYLMGGGLLAEEPLNAANLEKQVDAEWDKHWPDVYGSMIGYLKRRSEHLHKPAKEAGCAWPSTRTWELAARALTGCRIFGLGAKEEQIAAGAYISHEVYREFYQWQKTADLPDPRRILDGEETFEHNKSRLDRTAAVLTACTGVLQHQLKEDPENAQLTERVKRMWGMLSTLIDDCADVTIPSVVVLCNSHLIRKLPEAYGALGKLEPVLSAAGVKRNG